MPKFLLLLALAALLLGAAMPVSMEEELLQHCNEVRQAQGLLPLEFNWELARVARHKTEDMRLHAYFGPNSPMFGSVFDMLKNFNILFQAADLNVAKGGNTPQAVLEDWLATPSQRQRLLDPAFTQAGVGYTQEGDLWAIILIAEEGAH